MKLLMFVFWISGILIGNGLGSYHTRTTIEAAIEDNGCASYQLEDYSLSFKFARLVYSPTEIKEIEDA